MIELPVQRLAVLALFCVVVVLGMSSISCSDNSTTRAKASSVLLLQVGLRKQQEATPTQERLVQMQSQGMNTTTIGTQRIFIYLNQQLTPSQVNDLQSLGVTVYPNSWIPPVGSHPNGFVLADMPVDKLDALAAKDYVVNLDSAEVQSQPESRPQ
jgi:hypothetical protein